MKIDMKGRSLGVYHWDGTALYFITGCTACPQNFRTKAYALAQEVRNEKDKHALLQLLQDQDWSGAGYD